MLLAGGLLLAGLAPEIRGEPPDRAPIVPDRWLVPAAGAEAAHAVLRARRRDPGAWCPLAAGRRTDAPFHWETAEDPAALDGVALYGNAAWVR